MHGWEGSRWEVVLVTEKFCRTALTGTNFQYHLLGDLMADVDWTETRDSRRDIRAIENLLLLQEGHVNGSFARIIAQFRQSLRGIF